MSKDESPVEQVLAGMSEREQRVTRWTLSILLVVAVVTAGVTAFLTVHPLAGALVLLVAAAALWAIVTGREHAARLTAVKAAETARARQVSTVGGGDAFETRRPAPPPEPFGVAR